MGGDYLLQGYVFFNFLLLFFYSFLFFFVLVLTTWKKNGFEGKRQVCPGSS